MKKTTTAKQLIEKYKKEGKIPYDALTDIYPENSMELENLMEELEEANIDIIYTTDDENEFDIDDILEDEEEKQEEKEEDEDDEPEFDSLDDIEEPDFIPEEDEPIEFDNFDELLLSKASDSDVTIKYDDPVRMYLKEIGRVALLDKEEEQRITTLISKARKDKEDFEEKIKAGYTPTPEEIEFIDKQTREGEIAEKNLVEANLRLVISRAKKYVGRGMQFLDLIQEGNMGLMKAVYKFDHTKGYKFSTYATWWIKQAITRAIADQARTIRIPVHMVETINKLVRTQRILVQKLKREPTIEEIAKEMNVTPEKVLQIQKVSQEPISLESPVGEEDDSSLGDFIPDHDTLTPEEFASKEMLKRELDSILDTLTEREEKVLRMRFGLLDGRNRTLEEVGKEFGVTRERIRQIEAKALRKLRHPTRSKKLKDFVNNR